ncbi:MAG: ATP-binding protein [Pirellulales bacterium]
MFSDDGTSIHVPPTIVAIGYSACSCKALSDFFAQVPADCPWAFILIQGSPLPTQESRGPPTSLHSKIPLQTANCGMLIEAGTIYWIPPNYSMEFDQQRLFSANSSSEDPAVRPIDRLFQSLAANPNLTTVGVMLTSKSDDGLRGLQALRASSGYIVVQTQETQSALCSWDGSAAKNCVDEVLHPNQMPQAIDSFLKRISTEPYDASNADDIGLTSEPSRSPSISNPRCRNRADSNGSSTVDWIQNDLAPYRHITESALDAIVLLTETGSILYMNPAMQRMTQHDQRSCARITMEVIDPSHSLDWKSIRENPQGLLQESIWQRRDGTYVPVEFSASILGNEDSPLLCLIARDLSERYHLTTRLERMGQMVESSTDAILLWSIEEGIESWNRGACLLYGFSTEESLGRPSHSLLQTQADVPWNEIEAALFSNHEWHGTLSQITRTGKRLYVSSRMQIVEGRDGATQVLQIDRDITNEREALEKLEKANIEAEAANRAKTEFLTTISHELRTPMTAMLGFADILQREPGHPEFFERVETIRRNGEYLLALINDMLDLSKIEAGKVAIEKQQVDILQLTEDVRMLMDVRAKEEGIPLSMSFDTSVPRFVTSDRIRMRQILVNLISNALKFTNEGHVHVRISLRKDTQNRDALVFEVEDTGIGIAPDGVQRLFQPFTQLVRESKHRYGGSGLGLSISKRLAERMGADITVESTLGKGSRFSLWHPVSHVDLERLVDASHASSEMPAFSRVDRNQEIVPLQARVLLADDRRDVWRVAKYYLEKAGAIVSVAENGQIAIDEAVNARASGSAFDIVLMDMQMPVLNGKDAVIRLRQLGFDIPIIALTADAMEGERDICLAIGCHDYVPKPIHGPDLIRLLAKHLGQLTPSSPTCSHEC